MKYFEREKLILVFIFSCFAIVAKSQIPEYVFSGGKGLIGKGVIQSDFGLSTARNELDTTGFSLQYGPYVSFKYGVGKNTHVSFNYSFSRTSQFISDVVQKSNVSPSYTIGVTQRLFNNWSIRSNLSVSSINSAWSNTSWQTQIISEHPVWERFTWQNNLGSSWNLNSIQPTFNYLSGLTYTIPIPFDLILEFYGNINRDVQNHFTNVGTGIYFSKNLMAEIYLGYGLQAGQTSAFGSINFYYRLLPAK